MEVCARVLNSGPDADTWEMLYLLSHLPSPRHSILTSSHLWVGGLVRKVRVKRQQGALNEQHVFV